MFAQNNIIGYDPTENLSDPCGGGAMNGDTNFAKIVSYFSGNNSQGISIGANGIAAIIANFQYESGLGPMVGENGTISSASNHGYGVAQFTPDSNITTILKSDPRTMDTFNTYYQAEYAHYLSTEEEKRTGVTEGVPVAVNDAWLEVELDFVAQGEFNSTKVGTYRHMGGEMGLDYIDDNLTIAEALEAAQSAEDATRIFTWIYERPKNKERDANKRAEAVGEILSKVQATMGTTTLATQSSDGSNITIIGDSITERSKTDILELLPEADIYSQVGKQFYTEDIDSSNPDGYHILEDIVSAGSLRNILIYALGTNNTGLKQEYAQKVVDLAGPSTTIIFVTNYSTNPITHDYTSNNNVFTKMQNDNPNVKIANWAATADNKEGIMDDEVHPVIGEGTKLFAQLLYSTAVDNHSNECSTQKGNVTIVDGWAFPLVGATKANYLNVPDRGAGYSVLSQLPCESGWCHHDHVALDMGLRRTMVDGTQLSYEDFPGAPKQEEYYYYSTGVKVAAITDGVILYNHGYDRATNGFEDQCASMGFKSNITGKSYWIGHMSYNPNIKAGDEFKAGDVIGEVGPPPCAISTQAHLHINVMPQSDNDKSIVFKINELYEALPDN